MENLDFTAVRYELNELSGVVSGIRATIDGQELFVPLDPANRHYAAILKAVEEGTLVIQEAQ
jgi:hypothetical protein